MQSKRIVLMMTFLSGICVVEKVRSALELGSPPGYEEDSSVYGNPPSYEEEDSSVHEDSSFA